MVVPTSFHLNPLGYSFEIKGRMQEASFLPVKTKHPDLLVNRIDIYVKTSAIFVQYTLFSRDFSKKAISNYKYAVDKTSLNDLEEQLVKADKKNSEGIGLLAEKLLRKITINPPEMEKNWHLVRKYQSRL